MEASEREILCAKVTPACAADYFYAVRSHDWHFAFNFSFFFGEKKP